MRVAIFSDNDLDKDNGLTATLKAVLRHAPPMWQPRIYTAAEAGFANDAYFAPSSLGSTIPGCTDVRVFLPRLRRFAAELQRDGVDLIHIATPGPIGLAGRWLARRLRLPLVGSYHTHLGEYVLSRSGSPRLGRWVEEVTRWVYRPARTLLVPLRATRALLISQSHRPDRLRLWPQGVDAEQFSPVRASAQLRRRWQVDDRRLAILYAGRLAVEKGLAQIAPIRRELFRRGVEHRFIFAGDGPFLSDLRQQCPDGCFLGSVPTGHVAVAMASADLFLFPSATDALGTVVLEAQAAGLPVIVSNKGGPSEQMIPHGTGYVCEAGDVGAFVDTIVRLRHPIARRSMSVAARQFAVGRDWPDALRPLVNTWREAIGAHPSNAPGFELADTGSTVRSRVG